ncbi:MAG: hypothetical protein EBU47_09800 [Betaproteobacteria bacterium]|nr:hypothetical protein [Betaproteobacteria bacterium]
MKRGRRVFTSQVAKGMGFAALAGSKKAQTGSLMPSHDEVAVMLRDALVKTIEAASPAALIIVVIVNIAVLHDEAVDRTDAKCGIFPAKIVDG